MITKPAELIQAETLLGLLERFPGYTLSSLLAERGQLLRLVNIEARGRPEEPEEGHGVEGWAY